jgi:hypothetical protein
MLLRGVLVIDKPDPQIGIPDKIQICSKRDRYPYSEALRIEMPRERAGEMQIGMKDEKKGGLMRMRMNLKQYVWIAAMTLGMGITGGTVRVTASPLPQDQHEQDYSKNKNYQLGMRDGRDDSAHNRDHSKKRNFKKDGDKNDYETGYQAGHQGNPSDHR